VVGMLSFPMKSTPLGFLKKVFKSWKEHKAQTLAAALAFYAVLSMPALILLALFACSFFIEGLESYFFEKISLFLEPKTAEALSKTITMALQSSSKGTTTLLGFLALLFSASLFFKQLYDSLQLIFETEPQKKKSIIKEMILTPILGVLFIIFIQGGLFLSFALRAVLNYLKTAINVNNLGFFFNFLDIFITFLFPFLTFLIIFKLPAQNRISWKQASIGAIFTTLLFALGNLILGLYFRYFFDYSAFGGAGTLVLILVWFYYVTQILFLGAEFTSIYARTQRAQ
jgi:membrane protein